MDFFRTNSPKRHLFRCSAALLSGCVTLATAGSAWAQDLESADQPAGRKTAVLEEVIVTARKIEESRQDVPLSIAVMTGDQLEAQVIQQMLDLTNKMPNFQMQTGTIVGFTSVTVRGIEASVRNAGFTSSVSFYVDGIYQGRPLNFNQDLVDVERVELLLGPQGTLFGNNTIAGVLNIVTRRPTQEFEGFALLNVGNFGMADARASVNVPLSDAWSMRLSGASTDRDGFQENIFTGKAHGNLDRNSGRLQLLRSSEDLDLLLIADYQQQRGEIPQTFEYLRQVTVAGVSNFAGPPHTISQDGNASDVTRKGLALKLDYRLGGGTIYSVTSWKDATADEVFDQDLGSDPRIRSEIYNDENQRLITQEVRYESDQSASWRYTLGAFYLDDRVELTRRFDFPPPFILLGPLGGFHFQIPSYSGFESNSYAVFGNIDFDLSSNLTAGIGIRYSDESQDVRWEQAETILQGGVRVPSQALANAIFGPTRNGLLVANAPDYIDSRDDDSVSGSATLAYRISDDQRAYVRYAHGSKSGGFNLEPLPDPLPPDRTFGPETLDSYEIGFKGEWLGRRLLTNFALFYQDYVDLQRIDIIPLEPAGVTRVIRNAGKVEIIGGEFELAAVPTDGLTLRASFGYADAEYKEFQLNTGADLSGERVSGIPLWNASAGFDFIRPLSDALSFVFAASADIRPSRELGPSDATAVSVSGYTVVDSRLGIVTNDGVWEVAFWGKNLTDELYVTARTGGTDFYPAGEGVAYGIPRTYGLSLRYNFGAR